MTTDEEIKRFFLEYDLRGKIMPYNTLPNYLRKIQHYILVTHSDLDGDMLVRMLSQIRYEAGDKLTNDAWIKIDLTIQGLLEEIPYSSKISIIETYDDISPDLINALTKVNTYRNEIVHTRSEVLIDRYDLNTPKGKLKIRDLVRALKRANELFLSHTEHSPACKYYIKKQIEINESNLKKKKTNKSAD